MAGAEQLGRDETGADILKCLGRQVKLFRERAQLTQAELGRRIGYGEDQVSSVEQGRRVPQPEFLDGADKVLGAFGVLAAAKDEVAKAGFPAFFRDVAKFETHAVEYHSYQNQVVSGLLQTEDYARAVLRMERPLVDEETIEQRVSARLARQELITRWPAPIMSFVLEEATLHRPYGGKEVLRGELEHLLRIGQMRNVEIQVMPTAAEDHAGTGGPLILLEPKGRPMMAYTEVQNISTLLTDRKAVRQIEQRYGIIRAQALRPGESSELIEKLLGET
jgi:transcriptional regulator with XRE-family HTH domain